MATGESWVGTGTSYGVSEAQVASFRAYLTAKFPGKFRHGDCIGADATMHEWVQGLLPGTDIGKYPTTGAKRAHTYGGRIICVMSDPLKRNRRMLDDAVAEISTTSGYSGGVRCVALPAENHEITRSGTWAMVREALKRSIPVTIIWPDGRIEEDWKPVRPGMRVRLVSTTDEHTRLKPGAEGSVRFTDDAGTVFIGWDNGSQLGMIPGHDVIEVIQ